MTISSGQAIRSFLLTGLASNLSAWSRLYLLVSEELYESVQTAYPDLFCLPIPDITPSRFDKLVKMAGLQHVNSQTTSQMVARLEDEFTSDELEVDSIRIWKLARQFRSEEAFVDLSCWSMRLFSHTYCLRTVQHLLARLKADVLFNTSAIDWNAKLWTRAAALSGTKVITNVISWDNVSTKSMLDEVADVFLVWSDEMSEDLDLSVPFLRGAPREVIGSPQFEPIHHRQNLLPRAEFMARHGLDPSKKLILYTTVTKSLFPAEPECLLGLLEQWRENWLDRANVMIRVHPQGFHQRYQDVSECFPEIPFTLAGEQQRKEGGRWNPQP